MSESRRAGTARPPFERAASCSRSSPASDYNCLGGSVTKLLARPGHAFQLIKMALGRVLDLGPDHLKDVQEHQGCQDRDDDDGEWLLHSRFVPVQVQEVLTN
jgi:hypothetical protein